VARPMIDTQQCGSRNVPHLSQRAFPTVIPRPFGMTGVQLGKFLTGFPCGAEVFPKTEAQVAG
jgi:hypothetical protein